MLSNEMAVQIVARTPDREKRLSGWWLASSVRGGTGAQAALYRRR
jgi:hypothetical protein